MKFNPFPQKSDSRFVRYGSIAITAICAIAARFLAGHEVSQNLSVMHSDNTLLTISLITREALRVLENNLSFTRQINRQLTQQSSCPSR